MENRSIFSNISPLDHRYYLSNRTLFDKLSEYLSEEASIRYCTRAELALLKTHILLQMDGDTKLMESVEALEGTIDPETFSQVLPA